jgi:hypothetical protein
VQLLTLVAVMVATAVAIAITNHSDPSRCRRVLRRLRPTLASLANRQFTITRVGRPDRVWSVGPISNDSCQTRTVSSIRAR